MDGIEKHTRDQRSNSEKLENNAKLFNVIRKRKISTLEKLEKIKKCLGKIPQPDINAQDGNDNWNTALHLAIKRNELEVVNYLLSQGANTSIKNGDGKTPLQLAEERNHVGIINTLKRFTSKLEWPPSETERLASHTCQPVSANPKEVSVFHNNTHAAAAGEQTASTLLPPFSGKLRVDTELSLSQEDFKLSFEKFYGHKQVSAIDQLKETPPYPTRHVLAQFASMTYDDCKHGDPKPPDGWQLLTTASHFGIKNGYFGTACWHPERQQVVIAHRGTDINNFGALVTDVKGVLFNNYVNQMSSASTFANKVVTVLQEIEQEKKVSFEVFFTGHSLGGWLAQITTFSTEYLEEKGGTFLKKHEKQGEQHTSSTVEDSHDVRRSYHPHTIVFDSPGCKDMLSQMADEFDVRLHGRSIDLHHLDITSYLSAPNLINTCNSHLGTVYRIFTDLSDIGFFGKHTTLYNIATHSMDKIVEAFDPETGQVRKDDKGGLKVRQVVDWPVSAGLKYGPELNYFFKLAEHLNNYHPEVMDISHNKVPKGYHPLRYQTKAYDECAKSLSVFTQDEREFLEGYSWLRHEIEFFKPEDLFCVMSNYEMEKEAEQKLRNFELDKENFRCPEACTLQELIPYVKRLVRLFPQIIENTRNKSSSSQRRKYVYQNETQRSVDKIRQSALDFNPGTSVLREFLASDKQVWQLRMVDGDAWTGMTKVYRVLQKTFCTPNCFSGSQYTILDLERLLTVNRTTNLSLVLTSIEAPHLLMIACGTNESVNNELRDMFKELFSILKQKNTMKIVLTTISGDSAADFIQEIATETLGEGLITTDEQLTWSDLTPSSQRKMLEKTVIFQGKCVALNQLTSAESVTDSFPLVDLLHEKVLKIGEEPVPSDCRGYNEKYYIDRTYNHNIVIRQDILSDKKERKFADLLASTEREFKQLCQQNPNRNVHWLGKENSGELVWQQSKGNLKNLRKHINTHKSKSYAPSYLDKLLDQAKHQRVIIIADKAGMGKTTALTHLCKRIKQEFPAHWLVRIDLNDYTDLLKAQEGKKMDKGRVIEFVSKEVLKLESHLEKELFKKCFEGNEINKVVVMVDGFDEICPQYKETVIDMLQILKQTSLKQLWVTTRPHLREDLEDNLQQLSYTLLPFSEVEQIEFLKKFWLQTLNLETTNQHRLQIYAEALIRKLAQSISDKDREFTGIPLQTRMLAEAFEEEFRSFYVSEKPDPELQNKLDLLGLYGRFTDRKYDIYYREKSKIPAGNVVIEGLRQSILEQLQEQHELLALEALFTAEQVKFLQINYQSTLSDEELARVGIVQRNNKCKPQFIHRTLAEYFVAEFLIKQLTEKTERHTQMQEFLVCKILLRTECLVIRAFLDGLLGKSQLSSEVLKEYGEKLVEQWNETEVNGVLVGFRTALHTAATEDNTRIIGFLLDSLKSGEHADAIKILTKMLLAKDLKGQTAWHMAAENNNVVALKKIWEWAEVSEEMLVRAKEEQLNAKGFQHKLLLAKDKYGYTALHLTADKGNLEALETLWTLVKEVELNPEELLLAKNYNGFTAWNMAALNLNFEMLKKLWVWAKDAPFNPNYLKNKLLLAKDKHGYTAWERVARKGSLEVLETLLSCAKEAELNSQEMLEAKNDIVLIAWEIAAPELNLEKLKELWVWANEMQPNTNALKKKLLLAKRTNRAMAWHRAAEECSLEALETLWSWAKEAELNPEELLLARNYNGFTAWQMAAEKNHLEVLKKLWVWTNEAHPNPKALKNKLLLAKGLYGYLAWHRAAEKGNLEALETLWGWAKEAELNLEELLLATIDNGLTAWQIAARELNIEMLKKLWVWANEAHRDPKALKNKLLLAKGQYGYLAWHRAAEKSNLEALETLWGWAKEAELNLEELLLATIDNGFTAWQIAVEKCHLEVLKKLWVWANEAQPNPKALQNKFFLSTDLYGYTACHRTTENCSLEALENLWIWAKEAELNAEGLLLAKNDEGFTAWQMAAREQNIEMLKILWVWAKESQPNTNELKEKLFLSKDKYGYTAWNRAAENGSLEILETLWSWAKEAELNLEELLLARNDEGFTAWNMAAEKNHLELLKKLWVWANEAHPNPNVLKNKLLLAKDQYGYTAWHQAAEVGNLEALEILWIWAKEAELNLEELLLAKNDNGLTAWQMAARKLNLELLKKMWVWANEAQPNPNTLKIKLFLSKDEYEQSAWYVAAVRGSLEALEILWCWAMEVELKTEDLLIFGKWYGYITWHRAAAEGSLELLETLWFLAKEKELNADEFILAQNIDGRTALHMAAYGNHVEILQKLWFWAEEAQLNQDKLKNKLLLVKDKYGYTAWHRAADKGNLEALVLLLGWAMEVQIKPDDLLLSQNMEGNAAWKNVTKELHLEVMMNLLLRPKNVPLIPNDLKNKLLLAKDHYGYTAWHTAAEGNLEALETLWTSAKEAELNTEKLLLAKNTKGKTAWQIALEGHHFEILQKLWVWAKEVRLKPNKLKNKLLLAKTKYRDTAFHLAAENGNLKLLQIYWSWAKDVQLKPIELLLLRNKEGYTAWQLAANRVHLEVLTKLWELAREAQMNPKALKNKLLLSKDRDGNTLWHRAAQNMSLDALEILWSWAKEAGIKTDELKNKLLLAQDDRGETAWHIAGRNNNEDVLGKLWGLAKEVKLNPNELKKKLLLSKGKDGYIAWHQAADKGNLGALETLWSWAKEAELNTENLLLSRGKYGFIAWHKAAAKGNLETLETLWSWAKEAGLKTDELKNKLLLCQNNNGETAWHIADINYYEDVVEKLRDLAKEVNLNRN